MRLCIRLTTVCTVPSTMYCAERRVFFVLPFYPPLRLFAPRPSATTVWLHQGAGGTYIALPPNTALMVDALEAVLRKAVLELIAEEMLNDLSSELCAEVAEEAQEEVQKAVLEETAPSWIAAVVSTFNFDHADISEHDSDGSMASESCVTDLHVE